MNTTALKEIIAFILGRKYYANIVATRGVDKQELCSFIFSSRDEALRHRRDIEATMTYTFVETISFRSRKTYTSPQRQ